MLFSQWRRRPIVLVFLTLLLCWWCSKNDLADSSSGVTARLLWIIESSLHAIAGSSFRSLLVSSSWKAGLLPLLALCEAYLPQLLGLPFSKGVSFDWPFESRLWCSFRRYDQSLFIVLSFYFKMLRLIFTVPVNVEEAGVVLPPLFDLISLMILRWLSNGFEPFENPIIDK